MSDGGFCPFGKAKTDGLIACHGFEGVNPPIVTDLTVFAEQLWADDYYVQLLQLLLIESLC
jgi:hypothetical protein